jgi:hypothetical protein
MKFNAIYEEVEQLYLPGFEKPNPTYLKIGPVETYHPSEPYSKATWLIVTFEKIDAKTKEVLEKSQQERKELSNEKLSTITNKEFLKLPPEKRLIHITKNNISSEKVAS